jgi:hypothetical protein
MAAALQLAEGGPFGQMKVGQGHLVLVLVHLRVGHVHFRDAARLVAALHDADDLLEDLLLFLVQFDVLARQGQLPVGAAHARRQLQLRGPLQRSQ